MSKQSQAWKALEKKAASSLGGERVSRGADFSVSTVDAVLKDLPFIKVDAKYRKSHAHHSLMKEIEEKYCKEDCDVPVLVTKHHKQRGEYATVPLWFLGVLLKAFRDVNVDPDLPNVSKNKVYVAIGKPENTSAGPNPNELPLGGCDCSECQRIRSQR